MPRSKLLYPCRALTGDERSGACFKMVQGFQVGPITKESMLSIVDQAA